jgi:hypothetical protein
MSLEDAIRKIVKAELCAALADRDTNAEDWIHHSRWPFPSKREACEAARSGLVPGAVKLNRGWYTKRRNIDLYVQQNAEQVEVANSNIVDIVDAALSRRRAG